MSPKATHVNCCSLEKRLTSVLKQASQTAQMEGKSHVDLLDNLTVWWQLAWYLRVTTNHRVVCCLYSLFGILPRHTSEEAHLQEPRVAGMEHEARSEKTTTKCVNEMKF